jgi:hypothetical protein
MTIIQKLHFEFEYEIKKGIIIEECKDGFMCMVSDEGFYGTYTYLQGQEKPILYATVKEILEKFVMNWILTSKLIKIDSTNEFMKIEELQNIYKDVGIACV